VINYYIILCVTEDCRIEDIKQSYFALAKHYHPDNKETGDVKKMALLNKAYSILTNPQKRLKYDLELKEAHRKNFLLRNKYIRQRLKVQ